VTGLILISTSVNAQSVGKLFPKEKPDTVKNILKFSVLGLQRGNVAIDYERYLGARRSLTVGFSTMNPLYLNSNRISLGASVGVRHYLNKKRGPLEGMYVGTQFTFDANNFNSDSRGYSYRYHSAEVGADFLIGKQIISKKGFSLDMYTGIGVRYSMVNSQSIGSWGSSNSSYAGPSLHIPVGLKLGFGW